MALLRAASALPADEAPSWLPTHVQVTVLRARGLRCKGGGGGGRAATSDAYAVLQLGRDTFRTAVAEKSAGEAEWREECALELPAAPAARRLRLTVLHRALLGADRFLGRAELPLEPARGPDTRWHKLHSKPGKKEKERGEIQVSICFTRHNLSASMFDLSAKEKPRSPFGKLKDKVTGKKRYDLESASAIVPSSVGALDDDDEEDGGGKKSKVKGFFLRNKLRKSSLTQSSTSLGSDSTVSSASLGLAGSVPDGAKSPSRQGSLSAERSGGDPPASPKAPPAPRSSLCINGSHVYGAEAAPRSPRRPPEPRFIPSPPSLALQEELKVSTKAVTLSNHLGRARMEESGRSEGKPTQAAAPMVFAAEGTKGKAPEEARREERKGKGGLFHHGGSKSDAGEKAGASGGSSVQAGADGRKKPSGCLAPEEQQEPPPRRSFPPGPHASTEVAGSSWSAEDPSASLSGNDAERESPAQSVGVPVPETSPPAQGDLAAPDGKAAAPAALSEWDDTFDAFASSRLNPGARKEPALSSEPLAFIDDPVAFLDDPRAASASAPARKDGAEPLGKAGPPVVPEMPPRLRPWADYCGLDVGANLVSTTQEATVIEDVLSAAPTVPRRKSSTPAVWAPLFAPGKPGEKGASAQQSAENAAGEEGDGKEEELGSAGENGWMTIATETAPEPVGDTLERERREAASALAARPFLGEGPAGERSLLGAACAPHGAALCATSPTGSVNVAAVPPWADPRLEAGATRQGPARCPAPPPKPPRRPAATDGDGDGPGARSDREASALSGTAIGSGFPLPEDRPGIGSGFPPSKDSPAIGSGFPLPEEAGLATEDQAAEAEAAERLCESSFETCPSRLSLDESTEPSPVPSATRPLTSGSSVLPEQSLPSGLSPSSKADSGRAETFWTALEEPEAAAPEQRPQGPAHAERPPGCSGEGPHGPPQQPEAPPGPGRPAGRGMDFKKADFWKADGAEAGSERDAAATGNPFAAALGPEAPTNPFVARPPAALPVQAVLPERPGRAALGPAALRREAPQQPPPQAANVPAEPPPFPHASQPLAASTPLAVAAAEPEHVGFPAACRGGPGSPAAARPCPALPPGAAQAAALPVLPRETRPAEKPLWQQTSSPHPVRPLSAAQDPSSGLDERRAATNSSVQPVAAGSHLEKTDPKQLKEATFPDQSAKYYHLTHDELIQLLLQREKELSKKEEHIHELENYIDQLLVRIMEHSPTLLQIPLREGKPQ